ncbi:hypothetical protein [Streptacidiphilus carbonis]|uniref:hypothetical protein n=1 Tax=Streptacidiphilus carbonis TaxID=105422 RepID=UPI0005AA27D2|nr:hypothetical protein [Streptacidiphilus carbonis]
MSDTPDREIRRRAHQLVAAAIRDGLNMWELDRYYPDAEDQERLAVQLETIARRLEKLGEPA